MIVQIPYLHALQTELSAQNLMEIQNWLGNQVFLSVLSCVYPPQSNIEGRVHPKLLSSFTIVYFVLSFCLCNSKGIIIYLFTCLIFLQEINLQEALFCTKIVNR